MTAAVKFFRHEAMNKLRRDVRDNIRRYEDPNADFADCVREGGIQDASGLYMAPGLADAIKPPRKNEEIDKHDAHNCVLVYKSLRLTPAQACDDRIWTYLAHFDLRRYVAKRWPPGAGDEAAEKKICAHYFVVGQRGLLRDNAVARLWWMGHIAARSSHFSNPERALDILLFQSDVRANLLERSLGMNADIFDAVVSRLQQDYAAAKKSVKDTIFERERFRHLMKTLNRIGGYRMLDALDFGQLRDEINQITG
ncbi:MAG: DUF6339 family protein [Gammaproteobacteria bacterium]